jgi:hypothetical protein
MKTLAAVTKAIGAETKSSAIAANATANTSTDSQKLCRLPLLIALR